MIELLWARAKQGEVDREAAVIQLQEQARALRRPSQIVASRKRWSAALGRVRGPKRSPPSRAA